MLLDGRGDAGVSSSTTITARKVLPGFSTTPLPLPVRLHLGRGWASDATSLVQSALQRIVPPVEQCRFHHVYTAGRWAVHPIQKHRLR